MLGNLFARLTQATHVELIDSLCRSASPKHQGVRRRKEFGISISAARLMVRSGGSA